MLLLTPQQVVFIHEQVIEPHELQGLARGKALDAVLERVHNRVRFGMLRSPQELAAAYAVCIAKAHCFNDANKRTAANVLDVALQLNGVELSCDTKTFGDRIVALAASTKDHDIEIDSLTEWLLEKTRDKS